jgi:hypothetical protein
MKKLFDFGFIVNFEGHKAVFVDYKIYKKPNILFEAGNRCRILLINKKVQNKISIITVYESQLKDWKKNGRRK